MQDYTWIFMYKKKQPLSYQEVLSKLMRYCGYQERSTFEVKQKMREYNLPQDKATEILDLLIDDNFLSDERFAQLFVRGKVNVKRWGIYKLREGLGAKGVKSNLITEALKTIDWKAYNENLTYLIERKVELQPDFKADISKLYRFLQSKGYEGDKITAALKAQKLMR